MTIDKRPNGHYRIRQMENGKVYTITVPYRPSKSQAYDLIRGKMNHSNDDSMAFNEAAHKYIEAKSNVLSPSTIRGYNSILRNMDEKFKAKDIYKITEYELQKLINEYALNHTPKSVKNAYGFICAVIRLFNPNVKLNVTLPQKKHSESYIPTLEDVKRLLEYAKDSEYYVAIYLAMLSLRRSEICALTIKDLDGNTITINKALVYTDNGYVLKEVPKTDASNRTVVIPSELADRIREQGYIYKNRPQSIDKYLRRIMPKLGMKFFSLHKLRHFFASYAHELGYSDAIIQSVGGWSTDNVMKSVYRHAMNKDEAKKSIADDFKLG